ncbi:tetratricopeptide repeat protein [Treponema parvum]|uniref:tetratricopeptide repeat protein n=1 Tax=Treponema parvum TaxID=138851 RepID=UPI001AEBE22C|nr:tetratricopeptide repeat protein [Treponema parvum]QTQ15458.1 tetratricopeptide repeat protein [Treponema parvum]
MKKKFKKEQLKIRLILTLTAVFLCAGCLTANTAGGASSATDAGGAAKKSDGVVFAEKLKAALKTGSTDEALKLFETLPPSLEDNIQISILKSSLLLSAGRIDEASHLAEDLLARDPGNIEVLELLLVIAKTSNSGSKRQEYIKKIIASDPNNVRANIELAGDAMKTNNYNLAKTLYDKALLSDAENEDALFGLGLSSYFLSKTDDAKSAFNRILEKNAHDPWALLYLGKISADEERYREALSYVEEAAKYDARNYDIYLSLGTYRRQLLDLKGAEEAWTKAISLEPDYFLAYAYRASLYDEMNKLSEAYSDYKKVVETNPKYFYAYESLGMLAWHEKDYAGSLKAFEKALSMNQNNISYVLMIAANYKKLGKTGEFKDFLEKHMKKLNRSSVEYTVVRLFYDGKGINAENAALLQIKKEDNNTKRGKFLYYMGLFYDLQGNDAAAAELYSQVLAMKAPLFFEYRLAEWSMQS